MVAAKSSGDRDFVIEDNVIKGKVVQYTSDYTSVGDMVFDAFKNNLDVIGQVNVQTGEEDTFAAMRERAVKCALWLRNQGIKTGDVIAVCAGNHLDAFVPCVAALFNATCFNPWDPDMNIQAARHFLKVSGANVLFVDAAVTPVALDAIKAEKRSVRVIVFGKDRFPGTESFSDVMKIPVTAADIENFRCTKVEDVRSTAAIMYSSGTTGMPKGVELPHFAILNHIEGQKGFSMMNLTPLWFSSLYWVSGVFLTLQSIVSGTKRIIPPRFEEELACQIIEKYKVSWLFIGPSIANRLLKSGYLNKYDLSSLTCIFLGGALFTPKAQEELRTRLPKTAVLQAYGMTELGGVVTLQKPHYKVGSCGTPSANIEIKVVDVDTGKALGPNESGELYVRTPGVTTGYYKNPEATKELIDSEGWVHTGDICYYNEDGELFIIDRMKELIKYRGYHVSPGELEKLILSHPGVLDAAVVAMPHSTDDEHPVAFVIKVPGVKVTEEELVNLVNTHVTDHSKLRGGVKFVEDLPHTPSGKIARKDLRVLAKQLSGK